jgi:hypothetical protein
MSVTAMRLALVRFRGFVGELHWRRRGVRHPLQFLSHGLRKSLIPLADPLATGDDRRTKFTKIDGRFKTLPFWRWVRIADRFGMIFPVDTASMGNMVIWASDLQRHSAPIHRRLMPLICIRRSRSLVLVEAVSFATFVRCCVSMGDVAGDRLLQLHRHWPDPVSR